LSSIKYIKIYLQNPGNSFAVTHRDDPSRIYPFRYDIVCQGFGSFVGKGIVKLHTGPEICMHPDLTNRIGMKAEKVEKEVEGVESV